MKFAYCIFQSKVCVTTLIIICYICILFCGCNDVYQETLLKIDASAIKTYDVTVKSSSDRGFHNDGSTIYVFSNLQKSEINQVICNNATWDAYSPDSPINMLLYGGKHNGSYYNPITKFDSTLLEGYYYFIDMQNTKANYTTKDIVELYNRSSINYILAIIDISVNKLYYFQYNS